MKSKRNYSVPTVDQLKAVLRKATCECTAVPVCCGSAYRNKGVQKLLDAIVEYMPAPTDIPPIQGVDEDGNEVVRHSSDEEPFSALAFKIISGSLNPPRCPEAIHVCGFIRIAQSTPTLYGFS